MRPKKTFDFRCCLLASLAGLLTACGGDPGSAPAATSAISITGVLPGEIVRTVSTTLEIAGSQLPSSGLRVTVPGDAKASCQTLTQMSAGGLKVACQFNQIGAQNLEIRTATQLLGTASVTVKTNVAGVSWFGSPGSTQSGAVKFGEIVIFQVKGVNLLADAAMSFAVDKCDNPTEAGTPSDTLRTFACTFTGAVAGQMPGVVKDAPGGQVLLDGWKVPVEVAPAAPVGKLPDTGIAASQCYAAGSDALVSCTSAAAIALNSLQDGMTGRDVSNADGSDGKLGFSYSTVGSYEKTECVKDNITGLTWEGKPSSGLRDTGSTYTNYGDSRPGDASAYVAAVNATALCGYTDWRLPTADELQSIVDYSVAPGPAIDGTWFLNTQQFGYWTGTGYAGGSSYAWVVSFVNGSVGVNFRSFSSHVRLVR